MRAGVNRTLAVAANAFRETVRETLEDFFVRQVSTATWERFAPAEASDAVNSR